MTPERWQRVKEIFDAVLECAPAARTDFLRAACDGDLDLYDEITSLLESHEQAGGFMTAPAFEEKAHLLIDDCLTGQVGSRILQYELVSLLGKGGMGEVYLAMDTRLHRKVALKVLPIEFTADADRLRRFAWEAQAVSALNHPNIITIYDTGEVNTESGVTRFIATEFVEGPTLRQQMNERSLSLSVALDIGAQIASALVAAHAAGIVHRDIKPENVIVRPDGYVKVLDFGLAKLPERPQVVDLQANDISAVDTHPGLLIGTPSYLSPEQVRGQKADARSDIFSFGVLLYEMLTGRHPFNGVVLSDILSAVLRTEPAPLPGVPAELQQIVSRALLKETTARYQSAQELLDDLKQLKQRLDGLESSGARSMHIASSLPGGCESQTATLLPPAGEAARQTVAARTPVNRFKRLCVALAVMVLLLSAMAGTRLYHLSGDETVIDSIAVLPFVNLSGDLNLEYFSEGVAETITNNLSRLPKLKVMSCASTVYYKDRSIDPQEVGRRLQVKAVLIGRVTRHAGNLIVKLELVDTRDHRQIWGDQYQSKPLDILSLQAEVSRWVSQKLQKTVFRRQ